MADQYPTDNLKDIQITIRELDSKFSAYHSRIERVRNFTRLREIPKVDLFGTSVNPARLARAHAIVTQARAFIQSSTMTVEVEPNNNSVEEAEVTTKMERWLYGAQMAIKDQRGDVYRQAMWHFFESGQWILRTLFDLDSATEGKFPFYVDAIDPRNFMFRRSDSGIMCAVVKERKRADIVIHELSDYYSRASEPVWEIPQKLREKQASSDVNVIRYYDEEYEDLLIDGDPVWHKPHLMGRVPFDIAFCNDMPSTSDRPEEFGVGLIYPVLDILENESKLMTKMLTPVEMFFYPSMGVRTPTSYEIRQAYPGQKWNLGQEAPSPLLINPTPNYEVIDALQSRMEQDISRATFPEAVFGPMDLQLSGYAYTQAMSGLQERIKDLAREPERAMSQHLKLLLSSVGNFNNDEIVIEMQLDGPGAEKYRDSFSVFSPKNNSFRRLQSRIKLSERDIKNHDNVRVTLQPNMDRDEAAKFQQAVMAKTQLGLPDTYVFKEVLKIAEMDALLEMKSVDELRAFNPEFNEFFMDDKLDQFLTKDKEMSKRFEMWRAAKQMIVSEQQKQMMAEQSMASAQQPAEQPAAEAPTQPPAMPTMPSDIDPAIMSQLGGQAGAPLMSPEAAPTSMVPPGSGMPGMPPMEAMPNTPLSPEELMLRGGM